MKLGEISNHISGQRLFDTVSIGALLGTLAGWLPNIAATLTIIWTLIRIYETKTFARFKQWLKELFNHEAS